MSESDTQEPHIRCRRTGQEYDSTAHTRCPYCWGDRKAVEAGDHTEFCDYDPKKDPITFGFPPDSTRQRSG